jgi:hypothetical protein
VIINVLCIAHWFIVKMEIFSKSGAWNGVFQNVEVVFEKWY